MGKESQLFGKPNVRKLAEKHDLVALVQATYHPDVMIRVQAVDALDGKEAELAQALATVCHERDAHYGATGKIRDSDERKSQVLQKGLVLGGPDAAQTIIKVCRENEGVGAIEFASVLAHLWDCYSEEELRPDDPLDALSKDPDSTMAEIGKTAVSIRRAFHAWRR